MAAQHAQGPSGHPTPRYGGGVARSGHRPHVDRADLQFSSGYTEDVIVDRGVLDEHLELIGKPFSMQALALKVRASLDQK